MPLLEAGWPLQVALNARGHHCFLEPAACIEIVNPTGVWPFAAYCFHLGRRVAAKRARGWGPARRWSYALGAPLIPLLRLWRILTETLRRRTPAPWHGLPLLTLGLVAGAVGEACGFVLGAGAPSRFVRKS
jgi:hypothetical protein